MANITFTQNNVMAQQIPAVTSTNNPTKTGQLVTTFPTGGTALADPGQDLVVQVEITNSSQDPDRCVVTVSDSHSNNSFLGVAVIDFDDGSDETVVVQFSDFPLQADQVTPMDKCEFNMVLTNRDTGGSTTADFRVF